MPVMPLNCGKLGRYFQATVHSHGPIGPVVEGERKKYAEEKKQQNEIDRRMNPGKGGRGAI